MDVEGGAVRRGRILPFWKALIVLTLGLVSIMVATDLLQGRYVPIASDVLDANTYKADRPKLNPDESPLLHPALLATVIVAITGAGLYVALS